jgi:hypothetical protein
MQYQFLYNEPIKTKHTRKYEMQGSHNDMTEKFTSKGRDKETRNFAKKDRQFRDKRRNRHQDA